MSPAAKLIEPEQQPKTISGKIFKSPTFAEVTYCDNMESAFETEAAGSAKEGVNWQHAFYDEKSVDVPPKPQIRSTIE